MDFLSLDENNRIIGIRSGSYSIDDKSSSEHVYTNGNLSVDHINALYNVSTGEITFDNEYINSKQTESTSTPIDVHQIRPAIKAALDEKAVSMGFTNMATGANSNTSLSAWRTEVWNWVTNINTFHYSSIEDIVSKIPVYRDIT
jgi:hypothetical protein